MKKPDSYRKNPILKEKDEKSYCFFVNSIVFYRKFKITNKNKQRTNISKLAQ